MTDTQLTHIHTRTLLLTFASLLACAGCDLDDKDIAEGGTESGDGDGDGGDGDGDGDQPSGACGGETITILEQLDEVPNTFSLTVNEMIADAVGDYTGSFDWLPNDGFMTAHAGTSSSMTMTVSYAGGEVRLTEVGLHGQLPGGQLGGSPCSNSIEIDAQLTFTTEDGLFAESLDITLDAFAVGSGVLSFGHDIDFDAHQGSLVLEDFSFPDSTIERIVFGADFSGAGGNGALSMEVRNEDLGIVGFGFVASFDSQLVGANSECGACAPDEFCLISEVEEDFLFYMTYVCTAVPEDCEAQDCACIADSTCPDAVLECAADDVVTLSCGLGA